MVKKGQIQKKYSSEFKIHIIMDMREHRLGYSETKRKYFPHLGERNFYFLKQWERVFLEEGAKGLMKERRGRACKVSGSNKGRPPKLDRNQHAEYQRLLSKHNTTQSMSGKGNCMDNGIMENFFGGLKVEMYYGEKFESPRGFIEKLEEYIHYYNNERISLKLKGMSPVEYRAHSQTI